MTGATGVLAQPRNAEQVLDGELVEADEAVAALARAVGVEVLERRGVGEQVGVGLALGQGGHGQLGDPARGQRLLHLGVGPERRRPLLEQQVGAHVRRGRLPDAGVVLGAQRLVVEVPRAVVGRAAAGAAVLEQVDEGEGVEQVAVAEDQVLVELRAASGR